LLRSSIIQRANKLIRTDDRHTDLGILVRVVRQDLKEGVPVKLNKPPVLLLDEFRFGGLFDNITRKIIGPSEDPVVWYVSEQQWPLIDHQFDASRILCFGAEGAGKSHTLCCYIALTAIKMIGVTGNAGVTAPTSDRLRTLLGVLKTVVPIDTPTMKRRGSWATYYGHGGPGELRFVTGLTIQLRPTHQASAALGSPIQGSSWLFHCGDEWQDSVDDPGDRDGDVEARLRTAPGGKSKRFNTATAKDSARFRNWKSKKATISDWTIERMPYFSNWSIWPEHWATMKRNLSEREFKRRCLAMDLPPESAIYHAWDRAKNLVPVPQIGAVDVTSRVLQRYGNNLEILCGHDPGNVQDVTILLKAYQLHEERLHRWYVIDELTTRGTSEHHAAVLVELLRSQWNTNYPGEFEAKALIRCDPYGNGDNKVDRSVYIQFKVMGLDIRSAQYDSKGRGRGIIHRESRIEMLNRLLCSATGERRLFVSATDGNQPCAKSLVKSFEHAERDVAGRAEMERKGTPDDLSHWPAALSYALWPTEKIQNSAIARTGAIIQ